MASSGVEERELQLKTTPITDEYEIDWTKKLGTGISGPVRMCISKMDGTSYALKSLLDTPKARKETSLHYKCSGHPNIVAVKDVFSNPITLPGEMRPVSRLLMVMELMQGGELFERIRTKVRFTEKEAMEITKQIAAAIDHCHSLNIAHRDLKPENLLLKDKSELFEDITVKLADFGFAKFDRGDLMTPQFTPYYVSPQVLEAHRRHRAMKSGRYPYLTKPYTYDKSCDMWSLGVIIYIMLCGYPPFYSEVPHKQMTHGMKRRIMAGEYDFPEKEWGGVTVIGKDLISRLLCVDPGQRMSVEEILEHPWLQDDTPDTELHSPLIMSYDKEALEEALSEHAAQLTDMRVPDQAVTLKPIASARNPMLEKRKRIRHNETESEENKVTKVAEGTNKLIDLRSLRDVIAHCLFPNKRQVDDGDENQAGYVDEELNLLITKALKDHPDCQELKYAVIGHGWDGSKFCDEDVNTIQLAKSISDVVRKLNKQAR